MIPDQMPRFNGNMAERLYQTYAYKDECNNRGMFAHVSWKWIIPFAEWIGNRKCLEIMAGAGYLSYALREKGIDIIASDDHSWHKHRDWQSVTEIIPLTANQAIWQYGKQVEIIIMAWPHMDNSAYQALRLLHYINPNALLVYIGEWGGCTANDNFFANFIEVDDPGFDAVADQYERFDYIKDMMYLGKCTNEPVWVIHNNWEE